MLEVLLPRAHHNLTISPESFICYLQTLTSDPALVLEYARTTPILSPANLLNEQIFDLGASLWNVLDTIRRLPHQYPQVDIKYDPDTSCTTPIILHLRPHIDLLFSGYHQRLHTIALRKLRDPSPPLTLRYKDAILSSPEDVLVRLGVNRTFGPTYPGDDLRYPGVSFSEYPKLLGGLFLLMFIYIQPLTKRV